MSANAQVKVNVSDQALNALVLNLRKIASEAGHSQKEIDQMERSLRKVNDSADQGGKKIKNSWGGMDAVFQKAGAAFVAAFAVERIVAVTNALYDNAAFLTQLETKATTVFGSYRIEVEAAAKQVAESMGMSEKQFLAAAAASADLLIPMGFNRKMAANLSVDLNKLSGALAQWSGGKYDAIQTSEILTKALLGEREQLKSLGISITEADVSGKLLEKGQKNLTGAALEQAKAMATLELIYAKSTDAQDAFANGTDNVVKQSAEAKAAFQDIVDTLTELLTPAFHAVTTASAGFLKQLKEIVAFDPSKDFVRGFVEDAVKEFESLDLEGQQAKLNRLVASLQMNRQDVAQLQKEIDDALTNPNSEVTVTQLQKLQKEYAYWSDVLKGQEQLYKTFKSRIDESVQSMKDQEEVSASAIITLTTLKERLKELEEFKAKKISIFDLDGLDKANKEISKLKEEIKFLEEFERMDRDVVPIIERLGFDDGGIWEQTLEGRLKDLESFYTKLDNITKRQYMNGVMSQEEFETKRLEIKIQALRREETMLRMAGKDSLAIQTRLIEAELQLFERKEKEKTEKLKEQEDERRRILESAQQYGQDITNTYFDLRLTQMDAELVRVEQMKQHELQLAGDNADAKLAIEQRYSVQEAQIRARQAQAEKNAAFFNIGIQTAQNIVEAFPNPYLMGAAALLGLLQAAVVQAKPLPAFKDGVYDLDGPGTATSDSIHARLSKGESVVPADRSQKFGWLLKPMIEDKGFSLPKLRELLEKQHPQEISPAMLGMGGYAGLDVDQLAVKTAAPIVKAIQDKDYTGINYDKHGFSQYQTRRNSTVTLLNNRNKFFGKG